MSTPAVPAPGALAVAPAAAPPATAAMDGACASCGTALHGEFCHRCGERRIRPEELTLRAFVHDVASEVGDLDSRTLRSIRYVLTRPGYLTAEYLAGRRTAYLGPLKLFLLSFAAMLLASSLFSRLPTAEDARQIDGSWLGPVVDGVAARLGTTRVEAIERINAATLAHVSWVSVLIPLVLGGVVALVFLRRERGFVAHLVFAAHIATFYFALGLVSHPMGPVVEAYPRAGTAVLGTVMAGVTLAYLWRAVSRVYGDTGWRAAVRAVALLLGLNLAQAVAGLLAAGTATLALLYL